MLWTVCPSKSQGVGSYRHNRTVLSPLFRIVCIQTILYKASRSTGIACAKCDIAVSPTKADVKHDVSCEYKIIAKSEQNNVIAVKLQ